MNLSSAIKRARKLLKEKEDQLNTRANQIIVATEFNEPLEGQLVIILSNEPTFESN